VAYFAFIFWTIAMPPTAELNLSVSFRPELGLWHWRERLIQALLPLVVGAGMWWIAQRRAPENRSSAERLRLPG
jgi:hypothetical protein